MRIGYKIVSSLKCLGTETKQVILEGIRNLIKYRIKPNTYLTGSRRIAKSEGSNLTPRLTNKICSHDKYIGPNLFEIASTYNGTGDVDAGIMTATDKGLQISIHRVKTHTSSFGSTLGCSIA